MKSKQNTYVTKTTMPPLAGYVKYLRQIWKNNKITNQGPLSVELETKLKKYLGVSNILFVSNGTVAIEVAIKALDITGEIITTPFSYVATTSAILWTGCKPVFVDIDSNSLNINADLIEKSITSKTSAILVTHVYGNPCNIDKINSIAKKHKLKVIYDAAHCFGVKYKGKSILEAGDVSTVSFHATKLFHTAEGGAIVTKSKKLAEKLFLVKSFGHILDDHYTLGINGKNTELHAAMGLCNLPMVQSIIRGRKKVSEMYYNLLKGLGVSYPEINRLSTKNYSYFPVIFQNRNNMMSVKKSLEANGIFPRRYFYPSLNRLKYVKGNKCPVSENMSERVLCLPLYDSLPVSDIKRICNIIKKALSSK